MGFAPAGRLAQFLIRFGSWSHPVIASEAKQSLADSGSSARDCFVARCTPRNDIQLYSQKRAQVAPT